MSPIVIDTAIGLEDVQRAAFIVVLEHLAEAMAAVSAKWEPSDALLAERLATDFVPTTLETIPPGNFHEGHKPSLINAPIDQYPNVAFMATRGVSAAGSDEYDHQEKYGVTLLIDVMVKSSQSEQEVTRRAHRTVEAVNMCIQSNRTLNGVVGGLSTVPTVDITDVFVRKDKERGHYGAEWFWCGGRLTYAVTKEAVMPSSSGGQILQTAHPEYQIDQV